MRDFIYREILINSDINYVLTKGMKNEEGKYIDLSIVEYSKAIESLSNIKLDEKLNVPLSQVLKGSFNQSNLNSILEECMKQGKHVFTKYFNNIDEVLRIEVYNAEDDNFIFILHKILADRLRFSHILDNSPFIAWIKDTEGRFIDVNKQFVKRFGNSQEDIVGKTDFDLGIRKVDCLEYKRQDEEVINTKNAKLFESYIKSEKESVPRMYSVLKWPYTDSEENIIGVICIAINPGEELDLIEKFKLNQGEFMEIAEHTTEAFIVRDRKKAVYISPLFENIFGIKSEFIYKCIEGWNELFHPEDIVNYNYKFDKDFEIIMRRNPELGEEKWIYVKTVVVRNEIGKAIRRVIIMKDVTCEKSIDVELDNLRMDFFANLSHEFRTPINVILGIVQLMRSELNNNEKYTDIEKANRYISVINQNSLRLLKLVNNLIDTTKIDQGYFEYNPQNYDIINFVENICTSVQEFANQHNIDLVFDTNIEEKVVAFDLDMVERIMLNLLSNAIKFSNKDKAVILVEINCSDNIEISVSDNGMGIEDEVLQNIFTRFAHVRKSNKYYTEGSGIGLALVESLVSMHGGKIDVKSKPNIGTKFSITIPDEVLEASKIVDLSKMVEDENNSKNISRMHVEFSDIY